jgi:hypothetical protein
MTLKNTKKLKNWEHTTRHDDDEKEKTNEKKHLSHKTTSFFLNYYGNIFIYSNQPSKEEGSNQSDARRQAVHLSSQPVM